MKTVWKYPLQVTDRQFIAMPQGAEVLSVDEQYGDIVLWALVESEKPQTDSVLVIMHGTGHPADDVKGLRFIGTVKLRDGALCFHVWAA